MQQKEISSRWFLTVRKWDGFIEYVWSWHAYYIYFWSCITCLLHTAQKLSKYPPSDLNVLCRIYFTYLYTLLWQKWFFLYIFRKIVVYRSRSMNLLLSLFEYIKKRLRRYFSDTQQLPTRLIFDCYLGNIHTKYFMKSNSPNTDVEVCCLQTAEPYVMRLLSTFCIGDIFFK